MSAGQATLEIEASRAGPSGTVGLQATQGALWTLAFTAVTKVTTLGSQIALAWFLVPEEFGLVAMTLAVMSFTAIVGGGNLKNILVQRSACFADEAGQMFWLTLTLNIGAAALLGLVSPLAGILFGEPRLVLLLMAASIAPAIQSLGTVYVAALQRDLRFRRLAAIQCSASALQNGSAVVLAWLGAGPYSLILPLTITAIWTAISYRLAAGRIALGFPSPKRWNVHGASVGWLMTNAFFSSLLASGTSVAIGLVEHDPAIVGFYFWGFAVSSQAVFLLVNNLQGVLFPALTRLNAIPDRQFVALKKAAQTLQVVVTPICLLQGLLAGPLISGLFHQRWEPAVPVIQWISFGLMTQPLYLLAAAVLLAKGRYRLLTVTTGLIATSTISAATAGALIGDQVTIARFAGLALLVSNLLAGWITFREFGQGWRALASLISPVVAIGLPTAAIGWWTVRATSTAGNAVQIAASTGTVMLTYAFLAKTALPELSRDVVNRLYRRRLPSGNLPSNRKELGRLQS